MNVGLLFGMVVAIFTIGLLLVFGYQQIANASDVQKQAEFLRTIKNIKASTDRVYNLGGESSEKFTLTFPGTVEKVCFMPIYRRLDVSRKKNMLTADLRAILGYSNQQLASMMVAQRISGSYGSMTDKNQTLLIFFTTTSVPEWYYIEHLEPEKGSSTGTPLCVNGDADVWLRRSFDDNGAWVDVEQA